MDALRFRRTAPHRHLRGLSAADRRRGPANRNSPHGIAHAAQSARVKGAAESGAIGAPAAIVSAIEDALRPLEVRIRELPVTPARLRALIQAATPA